MQRKTKSIIAVVALAIMLVTLFSGCGAKEKAKPTGHEKHDMELWKNANCLAPKTCVFCGYTEGEIGDHSVKVGTCHHCNEFQNKALFEEIKTDLSELGTDLKAAHDFLTNNSKSPSTDETVTKIFYSSAVETVAPTFDKEKAKLENILKLCGEYTELADIKYAVETALKYFPVKPEEMTIQECREYFSNANMCYTYILDAWNKTQYVN